MNIYEKLLSVQTKLKAPKGRRNSFGKYNYRSCEDILEAVKPLLEEVKASLIISDRIVNLEDRVYIEANASFIDAEKPESSARITITAYAREPLEKKGMDEPQITGTASSYARKYALNGLFLIDDVKDPDTDEYRNETDAKAKASAKKKGADAIEGMVNEGQCATLNMLLAKADITPEKFCGVYGVEAVETFPADKYDEAVQKLEAAIKAHKEGK